MKQVPGNSAISTMAAITDIAVIGEDAIERIWYRLKGEPMVAYRYFKQYLAMPTPRSMPRLAKHLRMHQNTFLQYSSRFKWIERAEAYDNQQTTKELEKMRVQRELADKKWAERRDEQRETEWNIAQELIEKVKLMLQVPLMKQTMTDYIVNIENEEIDPEVLEGIDKDSVVIVKKVIINEPVDWSAIDISRFFDIASKMARLATGMATEHKKLRIDVSSLTDEELERLKNE